MTCRSLKLLWMIAILGVGHPLPIAQAAPPWELLPFKRIDADPNKDYVLSDSHGPWMVFAASFAGEGAERQARALVHELRSGFKLPAYIYRQRFDFTDQVRGLGYTQDRFTQNLRPQQMKYAHAVKFDEYAVLVGDYASLDDSQLQKALQKIKYAHPNCLSVDPKKGSTQRFVGLRSLQRKISGDEEKQRKGPMGNAFATRNPLLPQEYFAPKGPDKFVIEMNRDVEYSLLNCNGRYTVRVATFRGYDSIDVHGESEEWKRLGKVSSRLVEAAEKAHRLTLAMRDKGLEAYEFHDRHESIVTIGAFDSLGQPQRNGQFAFHPEVASVLARFTAAPTPLAEQQTTGYLPKVFNGIPLDVEPLPIEVPRRSLGADYSRRNG